MTVGDFFFYLWHYYKVEEVLLSWINWFFPNWMRAHKLVFIFIQVCGYLFEIYTPDQ